MNKAWFNLATILKGGLWYRKQHKGRYPEIAHNNNNDNNKGKTMKKTIYAEMMKVTPIMATDILENRNTGIGHGNRTVRKRQVVALANAMDRGDWDGYNGETIKFDMKGNLVDGQHRLKAVEQHGKPVNMFAIFNVSSDAFQSIDSTATRTGSDTLSVNGEINCNSLAASVAFAMSHDKSRKTTARLQNISNKVVLDFVKDNPSIKESVAFALKFNATGGTIVPLSVLSGLHFMVSEGGNTVLVEEFITQVLTGIALKPNTGALLVRNLMMRNIIAHKKFTRPEVMALVIKAWNMHISGTTQKRLYWYTGKGEKYPTIITE